MNEPWSKFFWSDYDADEGLRVCSLAAQGLWMRMLCLMARATPKGELRIGGEPCTVLDLSRAVGETEETVTALLGELARRGVYSTTRAGVIYSRRLRKDAEISRKRAIAGKKGGMASLGKQSDNRVCLSKSQAKVEAKPKPQRPEARYSVPNGTGDRPPEDPVKLLFDLGVSVLTGAGSSPSNARAMIGKWRKERGDGLVMAALTEARTKAISDPVPWITKRLEGERSQHDNSALYAQAKRYAA